MKKITKWFAALCAVCFASPVFNSDAHATSLNYNFSMNGNGFSVSFVSNSPSNTRYFHGAGSLDVTYDTVTEGLTIVASAIGNMYGADAMNNFDYGNILLSNVTATANISLAHVTPGIDVNGLVGLESNGAMGSGTVSVSDIGLGNGVTSFSVMSMPMTGADFAMLPLGSTDYAPISGLGSAIYWQYLVTSVASSVFNQVVSLSWYNAFAPITINGIQFEAPHADLRGEMANVPEPATLILVSLGAFAARRRLRQES